jgi:lysozyme family protein
VNHGTERAIKWLQEAIKTTADGSIGPKTLIAWEPYAKNLIDRDKVYRDILARRIVFYGEIVYNRPDQRVFIVGWLKRAVEFLS